MRVWVDIENPPQVQYLTPLASAFADAGADVVVITQLDVGTLRAAMRAQGCAGIRVVKIPGGGLGD